MFKVLIIDDEPIVRKGIMTVIPWGTLSCEVVGEAANGLDGMTQIKKHLPDIIITDIHMPQLNGLEMIQQTRTLIPHAKIIVITGYREFDYLHEALALGAMAYLLKPTKLNELMRLINQAVLELKYSLTRQVAFEQLEKQVEESKPILLEKMLKDALYHQTSINQEWFSDLLTLGYRPVGYQLFKWVIDKYTDQREARLLKYGILNALSSTFGLEYQMIPIDTDHDSLLLLIAPWKQTVGMLNFLQGLEDFVTSTQDCFHTTLSIAIGRVLTHPSQLGQQAEACQMALMQKFYIEQGLIISVDDIDQNKWNSIQTLNPINTQILYSVKTGGQEVFEDFCGQLNKALEPPCLFHPVDVESYLIRTIYDIYNWAKVTDQINQALEMTAHQMHKLVQACKSSDALCELLHEFGNQVLKIAKQTQMQSNNQLIQGVKVFIDEHYAQPISLDQLSERFAISTFYLSRLFKRECQINLSEYVLSKRLEVAKELMDTTDLKVYDVGEKVGIADPAYFSKVFKKHFGMSPKQYQTRKTSKLL
jgi:two-component system response regulator YesN